MLPSVLLLSVTETSRLTCLMLMYVASGHVEFMSSFESLGSLFVKAPNCDGKTVLWSLCDYADDFDDYFIEFDSILVWVIIYVMVKKRNCFVFFDRYNRLSHIPRTLSNCIAMDEFNVEGNIISQLPVSLVILRKSIFRPEV